MKPFIRHIRNIPAGNHIPILNPIEKEDNGEVKLQETPRVFSSDDDLLIKEKEEKDEHTKWYGYDTVNTKTGIYKKEFVRKL